MALVDTTPDDEDSPFNTRDRLRLNGVDDKSSVVDPDILLKHSAELAGYLLGFNGNACYIRHVMTAYVMDQTKSYKETDFVMSEIMAEIIENTNVRAFE